MLKIQEFMDSFDDILDSITYLRRNLQIESNIHTLKDKNGKLDLLLLSPGQRADMTNPLVKEAHCLMLDDEGYLAAKAWDHPPMVDKPELLPKDFDLTGAICEEIADGEIVVVYNIDGTWFIGASNPESPALDREDEIKRCLGGSWPSWDKSFSNMNPFLSFIFNYVSPYSNSTMPILTPTMYLTGVINLENNTELSNDTLDHLAKKMDVARPNWNEISGSSSLSQRLLNMRALAPGLMLRDKHDHRVIIPNPIHKAVKCAKEAGDRIRPSHIAKILQSCRDKADVTTITAAYDNYGPMLELLHDVSRDTVKELIMLWSVAKRSVTTAEFAQAVEHHPLKYLLFLRKHGELRDWAVEVKALKPIKLTRLAENKLEKEYDAASRLLKFAGGTNGNSKTNEEGEEIRIKACSFTESGDQEASK
jgi:hypothetical protein